MPASGPVYQPTTVGYEQQNEWSRPGSYLSQTVSTGLRGPRCVQWSLLALSCFSISAGIIMVVESTIFYKPQTTLEDENGNKREVSDNSTTKVVITIAGSLLIVIGIILLGAYIRLVRRRKGCLCFPTKEQRLARQLDTQTTNGQIMTLTPSTDLLVAAQYGPVSEITYQPPQASEEEETRKLMANDNKECVSKERVVMRERRSVPVDRFRNRNMMAHRNASSSAPLASHEEITPSLRSSFCSDYYQRSLLDSSNCSDFDNEVYDDDDDNVNSNEENRSDSVRRRSSLNVNNLSYDDATSIRSSLLESTNGSLNNLNISSNNKINTFNFNASIVTNNSVKNNNVDNDSLSATNFGYDDFNCGMSMNNSINDNESLSNNDVYDKISNHSDLPYCTTV